MTQTKGKAPKLQVEVTDEPRERQDTTPVDEAPANEGAGTAANEAVADAATSDAKGSRVGRVATWISQAYPGNEHAVVGGLVGLLAAVMVFTVGVGKTLFIAVMILVGVTLGQCLDGNPRIINAVRRLIEKYRSE